MAHGYIQAQADPCGSDSPDRTRWELLCSAVVPGWSHTLRQLWPASESCKGLRISMYVWQPSATRDRRWRNDVMPADGYAMVGERIQSETIPPNHKKEPALGRQLAKLTTHINRTPQNS